MVSLAIYMAGMLYIGYWSYKKTSDLSDYMLGGRGLGPAVTALSAGASDMSGWMLMGLPGAMYATGLSSVWIAIGLLIGAYANYLILARVCERIQKWLMIQLRFQTFRESI